MSATTPTVLAILLQGLQRSFVHQGVVMLFDGMKWTGKWQRILGLILGIVVKILIAFAIDGTMIYVLVIDPFKGKTKFFVKALLITGLVAINIGEVLLNMGTVWSEYDHRRKLEEERQAAEDRHKKDQEEAAKRHKEIIAMLSAQSGTTTPQISTLVNEFKSAMFEENKQMIMSNIYNSMNNLDVSLRYEPIQHLTSRELQQRQLSHE